MLPLFVAAVIIFLSAVPNFSQTFESFESPVPVIASESGSTRALATLSFAANSRSRSSAPRIYNRGELLTFYVTNIAPTEQEGAKAFRVYAEDSQKRSYKFPIVSMRVVPGMDWVYAVTIKLEDEVGYWPPPTIAGDMLLTVTWRGLQSNRVRVAYGAAGGSIIDDAGSYPTPLSRTRPVQNLLPASALPGDVRWDRDVNRLLEQSTFGPTATLSDRVRTLGMRGWINEQLKKPYSAYEATYPNLPLVSFDQAVTCPPGSPATCIRDNYWHYWIPRWFYSQAFYGDQQLRHRVAWSLSQIWVVSAYQGLPYAFMYYHRILARNAFGNYRQIMKEMTLNPAMGNYLDMMRSTRYSVNENYARELMQLFTIGLFMLNQDGTYKLDAQGNRIPTYDQPTVEEVAKVLTGFNTCEAASTTLCPSRTVGAPNYKDPMIMQFGYNHSPASKTLLDYPGVTNRVVPSCFNCNDTATINYANASLEQVLDNIYNHPNVAPFVSKLLIQHLVTSNPSPAYVERVANVFDANRTSPSQMREVVKAVLLDIEARGSVKTDVRFGKLREPVQLLTNYARHLGVSSADLQGQSDGYVWWYAGNVGQEAFAPPTVFSYYQPDYNIPGRSLLGPEFGLFTTGSAVARTNMIQEMTDYQINVNLPDAPNGTRLNFAPLLTLVQNDTSGASLVNWLDKWMLHGTMTPGMRSKILTAITDVPTNDPLRRVQTATYLVGSSIQFQVQR